MTSPDCIDGSFSQSTSPRHFQAAGGAGVPRRTAAGDAAAEAGSAGGVRYDAYGGGIGLDANESVNASNRQFLGLDVTRSSG